jgi:hypothetical protein
VELEDSLQMYFQIDLITDELKHLMQRAMFNMDHLQSQVNMLSLGHLSPCTINPRQFKKLLLDIKLKLPKTLTLPDDPDKKLWYFYSQLTCTAIMVGAFFNFTIGKYYIFRLLCIYCYTRVSSLC